MIVAMVSIVAIVVLIINVGGIADSVGERGFSVEVRDSMQIKPVLENNLWDRFMNFILGSLNRQSVELINKNILYDPYSECHGLTGEMLSDCIWAIDNSGDVTRISCPTWTDGSIGSMFAVPSTTVLDSMSNCNYYGSSQGWWCTALCDNLDTVST